MSKEGFEFTIIDHSDFLLGMKEIMGTTEEFKKKYDLIIYFLNKPT